MVGLVFFEIRNGQSATTAAVIAAQEGLPVAMRQLEELLDFSEQEAREIGPINANFMADDEFVRTNREFCKQFFAFFAIKVKASRQKLTRRGDI